MVGREISSDSPSRRMARQKDPSWKHAKEGDLLQPWEHRAKRLDAVLEAKGISPRDLSLRAELSSGHVSHVLTGRIKAPSVDFWQDVARLTGTTLSYLVEGKLPMFESETDPERNRFPSRLGALLAAQHLPSSYAHRVIAELQADSNHPDDPGHSYWSAQLALLVAKHSNG